MATLNIRCTEELKDKLQAIAKEDNRSITKELIQLIEDRYRSLNKQGFFFIYIIVIGEYKESHLSKRIIAN